MFPDSTDFERLRYRQGQRLRRRDFRDQAAIDEQLRWWHNRALHNAFGIVDGLAATLTTGLGRSAVRLTRGIAYDCFGRELVLAQDTVIPVPDVDRNLTLVLRYPDTPSGTASSSGARAPCAKPACHPELTWKATEGLTIRDGVAVCRRAFTTAVRIAMPPSVVAIFKPISPRFTFADGVLTLQGVMQPDERDALLDLPFGDEGLNGLNLRAYREAIFELFEASQIDFAVPRSRLLARPRIATGATVPGSTAWRLWTAGPRVTTIGLQVDVDTSSAGFIRTPVYVASLQGLAASEIIGSSLATVFLEHVDRTSSSGFVFRFYLPAFVRGSAGGGGLAISVPSVPSLATAARRAKLFVRWWAVEAGSQDSGVVAQ